MFILLVSFLVSFVMSMLLAPKPKIQNVAAASLDDFSFPTNADRPIPVFWGTVKNNSPNVLWYGNFYKRAITQRVKTGLFSKKTQTIGHQYYVDMQLAIGLNSMANMKINKIYIGKVVVWEGDDTDNHLIFSDRTLYGDRGGVEGEFIFYRGGEQSLMLTENHLTTHSTHYKNLAFIYAKDFYIGNSQQVEPVSFEISRFPNFGILDIYTNIDGDANPACILYDILVFNDDTSLFPKCYGADISPALIDTQSFENAAIKLYEEGMGMSFIWSTNKTYSEVIQIIEKHTNGILRQNTETGLLEFKLLRHDYVDADLLELNESNIISIKDFTRGTVDVVHNEVRVTYLSRDDGYEERSVTAQNLSVYIERQSVSSVSVDFHAFTKASTAQIAAWREILPLSVPLAKTNLVCNREAFMLNTGDPVKLFVERLGITTPMVFRVLDSDIGSLTNGQINLSLIQDAFDVSTPAFVYDIGTKWVDPDGPPIDIVDTMILEIPRLSTEAGFLLMGARPAAGTNGNGYSIAFNIDSAGWLYSDQLTGSVTSNYDTGYCPFGVLESGIDKAETSIIVSGMDIGIIEPEIDSERKTGSNLAYIDSGNPLTSEWVSVGSTTKNLDGTYTMSIWRGCIDTAPMPHLANAKIWFVSYNSRIITHHGNPAILDVKLLNKTGSGTLAFNSATTRQFTKTGRSTLVNSPANLRVNNAIDNGIIERIDATLTFSRRSGISVLHYYDSTDEDAPGATYDITVYDDLDNVIKTASITGVTWTFDDEIAIHPTGERYDMLKFKIVTSASGVSAFQERWITVTRIPL